MTKNYTPKRLIELFSKFVGAGLNMVPLKDNKYDDPSFVSFFLKCKMIDHELKTKKIRFSMPDSLINNLL